AVVCFHHWIVFSWQAKTTGAPSGLIAATAAFGSFAASTTAMQTDRTSCGVSAKAATGARPLPKL
ncbi:MAG TPA: hypothetical protein VFH53_00650, partial [Phycisphaerae bacterium]|nr:hypothetical protein [Phycisphaerae bacterium]